MLVKEAFSMCAGYEKEHRNLKENGHVFVLFTSEGGIMGAGVPNCSGLSLKCSEREA